MGVFAVMLDKAEPNAAERIREKYPDHYKLSEMERRLTRLETKMESVATKTDVAEIGKQLEGLKSELWKWVAGVTVLAGIGMFVAIVRSFWPVGGG